MNANLRQAEGVLLLLLFVLLNVAAGERMEVNANAANCF
jgi:hypothetical protein